MSIRQTCLSFSISETCYRYAARLSDENDVIADWLAELLAWKLAAKLNNVTALAT